jgi:outer membrane protein TolC
MNHCIDLSRRLFGLAALLALSVLATGCSPQQPFYFFEDGDLSHYVGMATNIEYPDVNTCSLAEVDNPPAPFTISHPNCDNVWDLKLEDAVRIALENGKVMRSLGARLFITPNLVRTQIANTPDVITTQPAAVQTVYEPAIVETDPIFGVEGALSAFDAQLTASMIWDKHDTPQNLNVAGQFPNSVFQQDLGTFQEGISKVTATGGQFSFVNNTVYNDNNSLAQQVPHDWTTNFEFNVKQPLLQGAGSLYNRIAGPFDPLRGIGTYLQYDGVVIARIRTDIRLADFEAGVRNFVSDVENAYWELYFAYRNVGAAKIGRDSALQTWRKVHALFVGEARGGEADKEAQAREQYFFFRGSLETALADLYRAENRLRYMMGLAATDCRLIRPIDEPTDARVCFDWCEVHAEGLCRSVELRQQKWRVKQMEMQLIASKNLLLPRLDALGTYRFLGLGEDLIQYPGQPFSAANGGVVPGTDAFSTLAHGDFQEWEAGLQFSMPIGFRQPLAAVRNAQLQLARERSVLQDMELEVSHQLADAIRDVDTNYTLAQTNFNRRVAAEREVEAVLAAYDAGTVTLDLLLEAQRNRSDAEAAYYRALTDYNKAIMLVHYRKGSLLEYNGVYLAEGPWPAKAYFDATRRARARDAGTYLDYGFTRPAVFSTGPYPQFQDTDGTSGHMEGAPTQAMPEEVPAPQKQKATPAGGSELPSPEPMTNRNNAASVRGFSANASRTNSIPLAKTLPTDALAPAALAVKAPALAKSVFHAAPTASQPTRPSTVKVSVIKDEQVKQTSYQQEKPFDWGDLPLDSSSTNTSADTGSSPSAAAGEWRSSSPYETDPTQSTAATDRPAAGWKRAQH